MFNYTGSPYSPFFTSGFLSESSPASSRSSSRSASPEMAPGPRRGSLPTDTTQTQSPTVESSTYYSALQPQRDVVEYRSFLSLDLAESQTLRTVSLRRQETASSLLKRLPPICTKTFTHNSNSSRSSSRSRTIPSPKPAPISSLPDLPPLFLSSPRASTSQLPSPLPLSSPTLPSSPSPESQERLSAFQFPPRSVVASTSTLTVTQSHSASPSTSKLHTRSASRTTISTVSTSHRKSNRSDALACLEGRSKSAQRVPYKKVARNFMSMSDDEDEDEDSAEGDADDELDSNEDDDEEECLQRVHRVSHKLDEEELILTRLRLLDSDDDDESILVPIYAPKTAPILHSFPAPPPLPIFSSPSRPQSDAASSPRRTRWGQGNPLVSFIDFKDPLQQQQHHQRVSFMDLDYSNALNKDVDAMGSSWNSWRGLGGVTVS